MDLSPIIPPVRILIRTRPDQLEKLHTSAEEADIILIEKLCAALSIMDTTKVKHLITKISQCKGKDRADIVFDYGEHSNEGQPQVLAYAVTVGSSLIVTQLCHPYIPPKVNQTVEIWRSINSDNNLSFPSRTDVRKSRHHTPSTQSRSAIAF
jgi:hypothetical protein